MYEVWGNGAMLLCRQNLWLLSQSSFQ